MNKFFNPIERLRALEEMRDEAFAEQLELQKQERELRARSHRHLENSTVLNVEINNLRTAIMQQGGSLKIDLQEYDGLFQVPDLVVPKPLPTPVPEAMEATPELSCERKKKY